MNTGTEFDLIEEQSVEPTQQPDLINLSVSELDLVGGGDVIAIFA